METARNEKKGKILEQKIMFFACRDYEWLKMLRCALSMQNQ